MMEMDLHNRVKPESVIAASGDVDNVGYNQDDRELIRLGKRPVLKVSMLSFTPVNL